MGQNKDVAHFVIFDKIRRDTDLDALLYLLNLPEIFKDLGGNVFFIYSSSIYIKQFSSIHIKLKEFSLHDTGLILRDEFGSSHFTSSQINQIHEQSEGVVAKLEQIMSFLEVSSVHEVLSQDDIFDNTFHTECIPTTTLKQINILIKDPDKALTLRMLNILSILKNGETLSNLRKDEMGVKLSPKNTKELIDLGLATSVYIDEATRLVRINPIIKDYILSKMSQENKYHIANAYLKISVIETKKGVKLNSINRKIYDKGYNTEEDNSNTLLKYSIQECKQNIIKCNPSNDELELHERRLSKLLYLSRAYVYILSNSSRYNETISAIDNLIDIIKDVDSENIYKYYRTIAYAHRMKSNYEEAERYIKMCEELCPETDKGTLESIYIEKLHLLEITGIEQAIDFARKSKTNYHKNSIAYIVSDVVLANKKERNERIKFLERQERKSRKLKHHTVANNILFTLNKERTQIEKINLLDNVLQTDTSAYNICRATIYKHEVLVENGNYNFIKESDIEKLLNIHNYLFRQKFDTLFNKCHSVLWSIAEHRKNNDLLFLIFYKGTIVWKLNSDIENENKYKHLLDSIDNSNQTPLLGNVS